MTCRVHNVTNWVQATYHQITLLSSSLCCLNKKTANPTGSCQTAWILALPFMCSAPRLQQIVCFCRDLPPSDEPNRDDALPQDTNSIPPEKELQETSTARVHVHSLTLDHTHHPDSSLSKITQLAHTNRHVSPLPRACIGWLIESRYDVTAIYHH